MTDDTYHNIAICEKQLADAGHKPSVMFLQVLTAHLEAVERKVCLGGTILDSRGNRCWDGDKVRMVSYIDNQKILTLKWNQEDRSFWVYESCGYGRRLMDLPFEKIEK